ncbi:MAG: transketolase family protein [Roseburia sp.]
MRNTYKSVIYDLHKENEKIVSVIADSGTDELRNVREDFPSRVVECGLSECNAIGVAAGMAASGSIPIVYGMAPFLLYRAYEFIRDDICIQNLNVKIVGSGAGIIYNNLGPTHHATEDIAIMRTLPNMKVLSIASPKEVIPVMKCAVQLNGPVYVRFGKAWEEEIYDKEAIFEYGKGTVLREGKDMTIISTGSIISSVLKAHDLLEKEGYTIRVINFSTVKPIDKECIKLAAKETGKILVVEEHSVLGGLASAVAEVVVEGGIGIQFRKMGFENRFCTDYGWYQDIKRLNGLGEDDIYMMAKKML